MANHNTQHDALWQSLQSSFEQDLPITTKMLELLKKERKALETRSYDEFQVTVTAKQSLLSELESHSKIRQRLMIQHGFKDEPSTLSAAESQAPAVAKIWKSLGEQWAQCRELNDINDRIAKRTRQVVGQVLDLLRGQNTQQKLYDGKGSTHGSQSGRPITSA